MSCKPVAIRADVLNDLATRFLINIPDEDKDDPLKLCSHIEIAHWFYLDLIRPEDPSLPGCSMKEFMATIFNHCPFLVRDSVAQDLDSLQSQWKSHKYRRPTRGAIILDQTLTKCLLVQGYPASTSWGFPKGKLERGESDEDCAIREVYEETGFDIRALIQSEHYLECQSRDSERPSRMYIVPGVPEKTEFKPRVRKEIRDIQWFKVEDLPRHKKDLTSRQNLGKNPSSFFMIIPFISQLKKWIARYQKGASSSSSAVGGGTKKASRTLSAAFPSPAQSLQPQQQRSSSSPSVPSPQPSQRVVPAGVPGQFVAQSQHTRFPLRAGLGPIGGVRAGPSNPGIGHPSYSAGQWIRGVSVVQPPSHAVPQPRPVLLPGHMVPPHHAVYPPTLWQVPSHQFQPSHPHQTHTPTLAHRHTVPRPSAFNPIRTSSVPYTQELTPSNYNHITTHSVSVATMPGSSKVMPVSSPYQWNGNEFRPVQLKLQPAQSWTRFKFDKPRILSAVYMLH